MMTEVIIQLIIHTLSSIVLLPVSHHDGPLLSYISVTWMRNKRVPPIIASRQVSTVVCALYKECT